MMNKQGKQRSLTVSGKKAQVMSVDLVLSYFLFAMFILYMSSFIINISNPFSSYVKYEIMYKDSEALRQEFITSDVSREYLNLVCNTSYANVVSTRASYEAEGIKMPGFDEDVNSSKSGIQLKRENNDLILYFNTNTTTNISFVFVTSDTISVSNQSTEIYDSYNKTITSRGSTISINVNNSYEDADTYIINVNATCLFFVSYLGDMEEAYLGTTPLKYSCGDERGLAKKSYFLSYAVLEESDMIVSYGVEVWWE